MDVFLIHIVFGILLFFIINFIGKNSYSIGYVEVSFFTKTEEAPALNFLIRVLTPVVYIIIISSAFYYLGLDKYVKNIYLVNVYYIVFRLLFNLLTNRRLLINWFRQFIYWAAILSISYFLYAKIIKVKANVLPNFSDISNELWIIILVFVYQVLNNIQFAETGKQRRMENYIRARYYYFKNKYGSTIKELTQNEILEVITYAIIMYEDFNRPKAARILENLRFRTTHKPHTLGIMQVSSNKLLSDKESVKVGTMKIVKAYKSFLAKNKDKSDELYEWYAMNEIIGDYNTGEKYNSGVSELVTIIKNNFYFNSSDKL